MGEFITAWITISKIHIELLTILFRYCLGLSRPSAVFFLCNQFNVMDQSLHFFYRQE